MFRKFVAVAMVAALMAGASGSYAHGGEKVFDLASPNASINDLNNSPSSVIPSTNVLEEDNPGDDVLVGASASMTGTQTVTSIRTTTGGIGIGRKVNGDSFDGTSAPFDLTVTAGINSGGDLFIGGDVRELEAASIQATKNITVSGANTTVTAGQLVISNPGDRSIIVDNNGTLKITQQTNLDNSNGGKNTFELRGSNASFAGGLTVNSGGELNVGASSTGGAAVSNLAVGARNAAVGGLRVELTGVFVVDDGSTLNVLEALANPAATTATEEKYGDIVLSGTSNITMGANSTINAGILEVQDTSELVDGGTNTTGSALNLKGLTVATGATFNGRDGVVINGGVGDIQGTHEMVDTETYDSLTIGEEGRFTFNGTSSKTLTLNTGTNATGTITLTQGAMGGTRAGVLENISGFDLTIQGATKIDVVAPANPGMAAVIQTTDVGSILATGSVLTVGADLNVTAAANSRIAVKQLKVTEGAVVVTGAGEFSSAEQAVIGGGQDNASYQFTGDNTVWSKGVLIGQNGSVGYVNDLTDDGSITIGGDVVLDGGTLVGADTSNINGPLTFTKTPAATAKVSVIGADSVIVGDVTFDDMDMVVNITEANNDGDSEMTLASGSVVDGIANVTLTKGEIAFGDAAELHLTGNFGIANGAGFYADDTAARIFTSDNTKTFTLDQGGWAAADGATMNIDGFASASLNGTMAYSLNGTGNGSGTLVFSPATEVVVSNNATFIFDADLTEALDNGVSIADDYAMNGAVLIEGGLDNVDFTDRTVKSGLGQFGLKHLSDGTGDKVAITSAANNRWSDKTYEQQVTQMQNNLQGALNENGLGAYNSRDLAAAVHGVTVAPNLVPPDTDHEIRVIPPVAPALTNVAGENNILQLEMIGTATGMVHESQLASLLGVNVNNGILATIGSVNTFGTQITNRLANNRAIFNEASSSDYANASILLNSEYVNRIWAGAIGHWEDGDRRHGIDGYEYDSYGFILGYDRYFGCNLVAGVAFAYTTGDFEDKSAINDDSDMDNYSFQGYLSYNALNGIFATLMGGYTYTDNDNQWSAYEIVGGTNVVTRHSEDYSTDSWNIGGKFGYDWTPIGNFVLTPSVGLNYVHASAKAHDRNSSRGGVAWTASRMEKTKVDALLLPVEVAARYDVNFANGSRFAIEGNVGYSYNFKNDGGDASIIMNGIGQGPNYTPVVLRSIGREQSRHTWNFGAGLRYHYNQFDIGVKYDYYLQSDTDAHRLMGTVGWSF